MQQYFNRTGYVSIEDNNGHWVDYGGTKDSLDFKFSGEKYGMIYTWFNVSILGLSSDTINDLTVWNPAKSMTRKRRIRVFAGYEGDGRTNPIFEGVIFDALPTNPPEMWMNFKCIRLDYTDKELDFNYSSQTLIDIITDIVGNIGMKVVWESTKVKASTLAKFQKKCSVLSAINFFSQYFKVKVYEENGIVHICDEREWLKTPSKSQNISTENGMLALGNITITGATIKRRLDDTVKLMGWVNLKSTIVPKANGEYCVIKKKHTGHFRGDEWYTELDCIRMGALV